MGYSEVDIPSGKDPEDYTYHERRSELLQAIIEAGHPDMVSRKRFAERYDVNPSTVTRDIQAIRDEVHEDLSADAELVTSTIYRRGIREKASNGDWMEAAHLLESWNQWLFDIGEKEKAAEKVDMDLDASIEKEERKALIGVDLTEFKGVDPDRMVGMDVEAMEDTAVGTDGDSDTDSQEIPLTEPGQEGETDG